MYKIFLILLFFLFLFSLIFCFRRKIIIRKICSLSLCEKAYHLNRLLAPLGFEYDLSRDIFTSSLDAWQKDYGYQYLYDLSAPHFNMVIDCEPVYFNYAGHTWLLEFWKGQYGINIGAEIGIYKADRILNKNELETAHFHAISDDELPTFSIKLYDDTSRLYSLRKKHWWLTGFIMGEYAEPESLSMKIQIDFPDYEMCYAFLGSLRELGYDQTISRRFGSSVTLYYVEPFTRQPRKLQRLTTIFAQWKNRLFLHLYHWLTRPFCCTVDKLLYLYEFVPFAFRHMTALVHRGKHGQKRR